MTQTTAIRFAISKIDALWFGPSEATAYSAAFPIKELRKANEILKLASAFFAQAE